MIAAAPPAQRPLDPQFVALLAALHQSAAGYYWRKGQGSTWWNGAGPPAPPAQADVYFGVHPARAPLASNRRARLADLAAITCLYGEFDAKDFAGDTFDDRKAAALAHIRALPCQPSVIIDSGGGYHCYWLLTEPYLLDSDDARAFARDAQARWVAFVGGDPGARDLVRVLRVPGTLNTKYDPPRPVELLHCDLGMRYPLAQLVTLLPAVEAPAPRPVRPVAPVAARTGESVIAAFNAAHTVRDLWQRYGGRICGDSGRCSCGVAHDNDNQASFTSGGLAVFYSSRCDWAPNRTDRNGRPIADAFDLYTQVEHGGNKQAAVAALQAQQPRRTPQYPTAPDSADRRHTDPAQIAARQRDAERKREQRRQAVTATMQAVHDRLAEDATLHSCESRRDVLYALITVAGDRDWCRPSIAQLIERTGKPERTVQRALAWLEGRYISTESHERPSGQRQALGARPGNPRATPRRTFLREPFQRIETLQTDAPGVTRTDDDAVPLFPAPPDMSAVAVPGQQDAPNPARRGVTAECHVAPVHDHENHDLTTMPEAGEGGRDTPAPPCDPGPADDAASWAALLAAPVPADDLTDPAALAAWDGEHQAPDPPTPTPARRQVTSQADLLAAVRGAARDAHRAGRIAARDLAVDYAAMPPRDLLAELQRLDVLLAAGMADSAVPVATVGDPTPVIDQPMPDPATPAPAPALGAPATPGASFTPVERPAQATHPYTGRPKATLSDAERYRALVAWWNELAQAAPPPAVPEPVAEPVPEPVKGPPRDPGRRRAYYALLGRAKHATSGKQRRYLEGQARTLEEWYTPVELAQARARPAPGQQQGARDAPPSPAPGITQGDLFAYLAATSPPPAAPIALGAA